MKMDANFTHTLIQTGQRKCHMKKKELSKIKRKYAVTEMWYVWHAFILHHAKAGLVWTSPPDTSGFAVISMMIHCITKVLSVYVQTYFYTVILCVINPTLSDFNKGNNREMCKKKTALPQGYTHLCCHLLVNNT